MLRSTRAHQSLHCNDTKCGACDKPPTPPPPPQIFHLEALNVVGPGLQLPRALRQLLVVVAVVLGPPRVEAVQRRHAHEYVALLL